MIIMLLDKQTIVSDLINEKMTSLVEGFESNEFLEELGDKIFMETSEEFTHEELREMLKRPLTNLITKLGLVIE